MKTKKKKQVIFSLKIKIFGMPSAALADNSYEIANLVLPEFFTTVSPAAVADNSHEISSFSQKYKLYFRMLSVTVLTVSLRFKI